MQYVLNFENVKLQIVSSINNLWSKSFRDFSWLGTEMAWMSF